jgi:cbb3-type cytochrome oxidase subunit 3
MGATATLSTANLVVDAGQEVTCPVVVRNSGGIVDRFVIEVVGEPAAWAIVEPAVVNLLPEESVTVAVRFAPPRSSAVPAGSAPFGVRVSSQEDPAGSVVEEGVIEVSGFADLTAEVVPPKVEAATRARYKVAVDNRGNYPVVVRFAATDPEGGLDFRFQHNEVTLNPETTTFVRLVASPVDRFLRGPDVRHRFEVSVTPAEREPISTEATLVQRQLLPKWLVPALILLLALALLLAGLWFFVLRPAVRSAAGDAAARQAAELKQVAQEAKQDAGAAKQDSSQAKQNSERAMTAVGIDPSAPPGPGGTITPKPTPSNPAGTPTDFRVAADAPIEANARRFREFTFTPPEGKTLVITDAILQNPRADSGTLRILRSTPSGQALMLEVGLGNFRDLDEHWVQPLVYKPGEKIVLAVSCQNPPEKGSCSPAVFFSGRVEE